MEQPVEPNHHYELWGDICLGDVRIGAWTVVRTAGTSDDDSTNTYNAQVVLVTDPDPTKQAVYDFDLTHRHGDGPAALLATVMAKVDEFTKARASL